MCVCCPCSGFFDSPPAPRQGLVTVSRLSSFPCAVGPSPWPWLPLALRVRQWTSGCLPGAGATQDHLIPTPHTAPTLVQRERRSSATCRGELGASQRVSVVTVTCPLVPPVGSIPEACFFCVACHRFLLCSKQRGSRCGREPLILSNSQESLGSRPCSWI